MKIEDFFEESVEFPKGMQEQCGSCSYVTLYGLMLSPSTAKVSLRDGDDHA